MIGLGRGSFFLAAAFAAAALSAGSAHAAGRVEVVLTLDAPPLARAVASSRVIAAAYRRRLDVRSPTSVSYLRALAATQRTLTARIARAIPTARVWWRYRVVLNGLAVVVPVGEAARLATLPGVARVYPEVTYRSLLNRSPGLIGAPTLWSPDFSTAGNGMKIGIIDDGVDQTHPFFDPSGYTMPLGFPRGQTAFTTAKVIVARAFPPPTPHWKYAARPFDPVYSDHGTHVAGIAAGEYGARVPGVSGPLSGIAPNAYIGNYKVLTIPAPGVGIDGNSPEIAAGIEAAVSDGMDVINLSLGEPEIEPSRDLVVEAIDSAAAAGVVTTVAAGNDFDDHGHGSIGSPGSATMAITAAAVSKSRVMAYFSSSGPNPVSLELKPDVSAPGVSILSSVPASEGSWELVSGTSMAAPHVAGAAALLRERHPDWTVAQIKSALVLTGSPAFTDTSRSTEAPTIREGGGLIDLAKANDPLVFAQPASLSFGLLRVGTIASRTVDVTDAGNGAGDWTVSVEPQTSEAGAEIAAPAAVTVPGVLDVTATISPGAAERDLTGFVVLTRGADRRRIPYWLRVTDPKLAGDPHGVLRRTGTYTGNTAGKPARVESYRYPDDTRPLGTTTRLPGPEQVFRVSLTRPVANFGVAILSRGRGVKVTPRVVVAGDENRLTGYAGLPLDLNPYRQAPNTRVPVAGAILPAAGAYDVVFDTPSRATAGPFTFRFWIGDATPPRARLLSSSIQPGGRLSVRLTDAGSGVDPGSLLAEIDGRSSALDYSAQTGIAEIPVGPQLARGRHTLVLHASDYQEAKNMENVARILPNTTELRAAFRVR